MKYTITINQLGLYYAGLNFKTDWNDWAIIDYLKDFALHPKSKRIIYKNEKYVWLNYNHLIANLPFCKFQGKWTVSRRIAKLRYLGLIKTYRAKDNTLYVAFTDKLIDICWAKRTDIEKMRKIAGIGEKHEQKCLCEEQSDEVISSPEIATPSARNDKSKTAYCQSQTKVVHNSSTAVAVNSHRGYCTNNATAQIVTKYQTETNNNISFSSSLKTKTEQTTEIKEGENYHENTKERKHENPIRREVKGFKTMSGIWQVMENIKHRGLINANSKSKIPSSK